MFAIIIRFVLSPSTISWYSSVFWRLGELCAASLALAASGGKWAPSDETGGQYSTSTTCLYPSRDRRGGCLYYENMEKAHLSVLVLTAKISFQTCIWLVTSPIERLARTEYNNQSSLSYLRKTICQKYHDDLKNKLYDLSELFRNTEPIHHR